MTAIEFVDSELSLLIKPLHKDDSGVYKCKAIYAGNQHLEANFKLNVLGKIINQFFYISY